MVISGYNNTLLCNQYYEPCMTLNMREKNVYSALMLFPNPFENWKSNYSSKSRLIGYKKEKSIPKSRSPINNNTLVALIF